jgi:hypothetical protein
MANGRRLLSPCVAVCVIKKTYFKLLLPVLHHLSAGGRGKEGSTDWLLTS